MRKIILGALFFLLVIGFKVSAQNKYTISGYIKDVKTGEQIIGASLVIKDMPATGVNTNSYGFYSITIPEGKHILMTQFTSYQTKIDTIILDKNIKLDFALTDAVAELSEVVVTDEKKDQNITSTQMGVDKLDIKQIQAVPVFFGEKDVLKTLQLLPGVKSVGDGSSGFYVRGGNSSQNLILLDEATVYNASHLLGFFSVFNSDAIKDVTLYKGTQPAEFGGRLSSVLDIKMKDGNDQKLSVSGGIGLISSRLNIEAPIKKNRGSFIISARRTYADVLLRALTRNPQLKNVKLYFYDVNLKANYRLNDKNRIYLSGYLGKDVLGLNNSTGLNYGNITGTVRLNHLFNDKFFSNTSLIFTNYDYRITTAFGANSLDIISRIQDYSVKQDFQYFLNSKNKFKFGFQSIYHKLIPGSITSTSNTPLSRRGVPNKFAWENAIYLSHELRFNDKFSIEYGARLTSFTLLGPGTFYTYDANDNITDSAKFTQTQSVKTYINLQPRATFNYVLNAKSSIKGNYARNTQYMHLLQNTTSGSPTDLWIPSSNNVKPELCDQVSLGYFRNFLDNMFETSIETYYKAYQNQIDYVNGAQLNLNANVESQLLYGIGRSYGVELFIKKKYGRFTGWLGYTLSRTERKINGINNDNWYAATQDVTHYITAVGIYQLNKKWTASAVFVYYTGNAVTFPSGKYEVNGQVVFYYTQRNGYRMPAYNRLDIGFTYQAKKTEKFESSWNFSCYNAYGRENPYSITFQVNPNNPQQTQAVMTYLFRWVPSITYNFKF
ncbi:MAG: carboxypeptidase-like regulatory domain-containing protein [Bacteroidia bacterium]